MTDQHPAMEEQQALDRQPAKPLSKEDRQKRQALESYRRGKGADQLSMTVKVSSPFRTYYDGQAFSISAENITGPFDILPRHHNFISLLKPCTLVIRTVKEGEQKIRISGGIMHVKADKIIVFLDV